ncbi:hypothetical protein I4641_22790, partial [Waterburya agarophytonicola K14]
MAVFGRSVRVNTAHFCCLPGNQTVSWLLRCSGQAGSSIPSVKTVTMWRSLLTSSSRTKPPTGCGFSVSLRGNIEHQN